MQPLYTTKEVAEILKLHPQTVERLCREGKIPASKIGKSYRITQADLEAWLEDKKREESHA